MLWPLIAGNVLKEIVAPAGAVIRAEDFELGDPTISILELWGAEYQESNAALVRQADRKALDALAQRERCPVCYVGTVTGDGKVQGHGPDVAGARGGCGWGTGRMWLGCGPDVAGVQGGCDWGTFHMACQNSN